MSFAKRLTLISKFRDAVVATRDFSEKPRPVYIPDRPILEDCFNAIKNEVRVEMRDRGVSPASLTVIVKCLRLTQTEAVLGIVRDSRLTVYMSKKMLPVGKVTFMRVVKRGFKTSSHQAEVRSYNERELRTERALFVLGRYYSANFTNHQAVTLPQQREMFNIMALKGKVDSQLTPLVCAMVHAKIGTVPDVPQLPHDYKFLGTARALQYEHGPPGAGKTYKLVEQVGNILANSNKVGYVIAETNELVLELSRRLSEKKHKHHVVLSPKGQKMLERGVYVNDLALQLLVKEMSHKTHVSDDFEGTIVGALKFSRIFVMTVNKFLSPKYDLRRIVCHVLMIDEGPLLSTKAIYATLNSNPHALLVYGDHRQGTPYVTNSVQVQMRQHREMQAYNNVVHTLCLADSPYHRYIRYKTRMPEPYNKLFLDFFYAGQCNYTMEDVGVVELSRVFLNYPMPPRGLLRDGKSAYSEESLRYFRMSSPKKGSIIVTPYLAQADRLRKQSSKLVRVTTVRPIQGNEADNVYFDTTTESPTKFLTNHMMVVALSRFKKRMHVVGEYKLPKTWVHRPFIYDPSATISDNYAVFMSVVKTSVWPDGPYDIDGGHKLKWFFFLDAVRLACGGQLSPLVPYDVDMDDLEVDGGTKIRFNPVVVASDGTKGDIVDVKPDYVVDVEGEDIEVDQKTFAEIYQSPDDGDEGPGDVIGGGLFDEGLDEDEEIDVEVDQNGMPTMGRIASDTPI